MNARSEMTRGMLTLGLVDELSDMLTVIMSSLDQLAAQPLTHKASTSVARANTAASRATQRLWQTLDEG